MNKLLDSCKKYKEISKIVLNVIVNNDAAISFYKKFNFKYVKTETNYYRNITPRDAYLFEKDLL